jgi:hypothetical protein
MLVKPVRTKRERDYPEILARTLNGQDRKGTLEWLAGIPHDRPIRVQGFGNASRESRDAAAKEFLSTLRRLADQWLASGMEQTKSIGEQPWTRNVLWFSDTYQERIDKTLQKFLHRNPPPIEPDSDGRLEIPSHLWLPRPLVWPFPEPKLEDTLERARDYAISEFQEFLQSGCPQRLFKCNECRKYFALTRKPREVIQHGAYCKNCKSAGGARRVEDKRKAERKELLKTAAEEWVQWKHSHRNPDQREWVAAQVSKRCRLRISKQRKWVSRNLKKILELVEEKHHA